MCNPTDKQLLQLIEWAKHIPHFSSLPLEDQVRLLRAGWNELLIATFSHRSVDVKDSIVLTTGITVHRNSAQQAGVGGIFDRVLSELVSKMREMKMDKTELGCLKLVFCSQNKEKFQFRSLDLDSICCCFFAGVLYFLIRTFKV